MYRNILKDMTPQRIEDYLQRKASLPEEDSEPRKSTRNSRYYANNVSALTIDTSTGQGHTRMLESVLPAALTLEYPPLGPFGRVSKREEARQSVYRMLFSKSRARDLSVM
ncbi:hypothetical protein M501DRAFT_993224 [Patellaria atrata CBS 101060]|uniref:Uncharacterized protein n=1 Tax=Patellaria atrata CBS 101060 TaxID=1346257 RepID=A0A9P4S963_9PEZI|nr:hypothetical protein M501DRAFT_993224 [Patellaria atrata CBS 101060]